MNRLYFSLAAIFAVTFPLACATETVDDPSTEDALAQEDTTTQEQGLTICWPWTIPVAIGKHINAQKTYESCKNSGDSNVRYKCEYDWTASKCNMARAALACGQGQSGQFQSFYSDEIKYAKDYVNECGRYFDEHPAP